MDDILLLQKCSRYELLLSRIAMSFGFDYAESNVLVKFVLADCVAQCKQTGGCKSYRILLSKIMVRQCVLKLSSDIFAADASGRSKFRWTDEDACAGSLISEMPLTMRAVFILHGRLGYDEDEVAEILNTSPSNVSARFNKARSYLYTSKL